jgi:hypothetical protein
MQIWVAVKAIGVVLAGMICLVETAASAGLERGGYNNRYFTYNGSFPYYVGVDLQQLGSDTAIDFRRAIDLLASYDINKIRLWIITSFLGDWDANLFPYRKVGDKWDLDEWDDRYWERMKAVISYARCRNMIVEISIFEILGLREYARDGANKPYLFSRDDNIQGFGKPNQNGTLIPQFYQLDYRENGRSWLEVQRRLIDKTVAELGDFDNVFFDIMNEWPGGRQEVANINAYVPWMQEMIRYLRSRTTRVIGAHTHGIGYPRNAEAFEATSSLFWDMPELDSLNFHLYLNEPREISDRLSSHQLKDKMLLNNEGAEYYDIDRSAGYPNYRITRNPEKLAAEIRHMWGHIMLGGYFTAYHGPVPQLEGPVFEEMAAALQGARQIMESVHFYRMSPVRDDGSELDDLVVAGPGGHWQVIAREGLDYLVYFCHRKAQNGARIRLAPGRYRYRWFDTRRAAPALLSGVVKGGRLARIPAPLNSQWDAQAGLVLVVSALDAAEDDK